MSFTREVREGRMPQGVDEQIAYRITTTPWGTSPSSPAVVAKDRSAADSDVSATVLSGSPSVAGDVVTTPLVRSLTEGHLYRIEVRFTCSGNVFEAWFEVMGEA